MNDQDTDPAKSAESRVEDADAGRPPGMKRTSPVFDCVLDTIELDETLRRINASEEPLTAETSVKLAGVQKDLLSLRLEAQKFIWGQQVQARELIQKWATGLAAAIAALIIASWGRDAIRDLKPVHIETGVVSTTGKDAKCVGQICDNVVRSSKFQADSPVDARGNRCKLRNGAAPKNDRPKDVGEDYYLASDFETDLVDDNRCFRQVLIHVPLDFSRAPKVITQISWLDALTADSTDDMSPILIDVGGRAIHKALNVRVETLVQGISATGFDVVMRTWYDSRIYRADVTWTAYIQ